MKSEPERGSRSVLATESDVEDLMNLQFAACDGDPFHHAIWGPNSTENRRKAADRLLEKWRTATTLFVVKCVDSATGDLLSFCLWEIVNEAKSRQDALREDCMTTCAWLDGGDRVKARAYLIPAVEKRWEVMQGREYALLTNLCTSPQSRKRGAARALVQWGLEQADARMIPAYCEASETGLRLYLSLGFSEVDSVKTVIDGELVEEYPVLVREHRGQSSVEIM